MELTSASSSVALCTCEHIARVHRVIWPDEEIAVDRTVIIEGVLGECLVAGCGCAAWVESVSNLLWRERYGLRLRAHPIGSPAAHEREEAAIAQAADWLAARLEPSFDPRTGWSCCGGPHTASSANPRGHAIDCLNYGSGRGTGAGWFAAAT